MAGAARSAAAALAAALGDASEPAQALRDALSPAVWCSLSVRVGEGILCGSGNLMAEVPGHSSLFSMSSSLAGVALTEGRPKLLQLRPHYRRCSLEDVRLIASEPIALSTLVGLPVMLLPHGTPGSSGRQDVLAVLSVGFATAASVSAPALKMALLVAHSLAREQGQSLREFAGMVQAMLLPQQLSQQQRSSPAAAALLGGADPQGSDSEGDNSSSEWGDFVDWEPSESGSDGEGPSSSGAQGSWRAARTRARPAAAPAPPTATVRANPLTLQFHHALCEQQFAAFHGRHLQRIDGLAYLVCLCFFCLEALLPAAPFQLAPQHLGWWSLPVYLALLPGLLLLSERTRRKFTRHRDWWLFLTWSTVMGWMLALRARCGLAPSDLLSALTVMGLSFQMRFRFLAPLLLALNIQLGSFHTRHFLHGVVLPLACCYCFEAHTRRLFLQSWASQP